MAHWLAANTQPGIFCGPALSLRPAAVREMWTRRSSSTSRMRHQAGGLQALEQGRERAGVEGQPLAEFGNHQAVALPQHEQRQVLRVGEAQLVEQRLVQLGHRQRGGIQREAQLVVQQQGLVGIEMVAAWHEL